MKNKLPDGWIKTTIADVSALIFGQSPPSSSYNTECEGMPFFQGKAEFGKVSPRIEKWCNQPKRIAKAGDILISVRAPVGPTNIASVDCAIGRGLAAIRSIIVSSYVQFYLRYSEHVLAAKGTGTTFAAITKDVLKKHEIPVPPLAEQKRIVDKIETLFSDLDKGETLLKQVQQQLAVYRQSVLKDAVTGELTRAWREQNEHRLESGEALLARILESRHKNWKGRGKYKEPACLDTSTLPVIPDGWTWTSIASLICNEKNAIKAGPFGSALKKEFYVSSGYKIYGQEQVISGDSQYGDYYINEEKYELLKSCSVKPFDVLISLVGTIGKVMVLPEKIEPGIINPRLIKISLDMNVYDPRFFKMYFESAFVKSMYRLDAHGATMDILNLSIIKNLPFALCSIDEQKEVVLKVDDILSQIDALEKWCSTELARSEMLRQSILKAAFSGELVPQDPEDEPASELLARIQAERASAAKLKKPAARRRVH